MLDMMADRPLVLIFEHPWQRIDDASGPEPYYFNSETNASRWDRPPELDAVLEAMNTWKNTTAAQPQNHSHPALPASDAPQPEEQVRAHLNEEEQDFVYSVEMSFDQPGSLGFDLDENPDSQLCVAKVKKGTPAARDPLSCAGLILLRVNAADGGGGGGKDVSDGSLTFDSILDLLGARPVTLTFEHPWQRKSDGSAEPYYYNSLTEESVWDKPRVLEDVAGAMRLRAAAAGGGRSRYINGTGSRTVRRVHPSLRCFLNPILTPLITGLNRFG